MTTVLGLREWRCRHCGRLLCRCDLAPGTVVEIMCQGKGCRQINRVAVPGDERLTESVQTTVMTASVWR